MIELTLIGAGTMGEAMLARWLETKTLSTSDVFVVEHDSKRREDFAGLFTVRSAGSLDEAEAASYYVLAVKPQDSAVAMKFLAGVVGRSTVMSIMAGVPIATIRKFLGDSPSIVRIMPNVGAIVGAAAMGYAIERGEGDLSEVRVVELLSAFGVPEEVPESLLDAVTALSGSGPAYFFLLVEALTEAGVKAGLPPEVARTLTRETFWGAARLLEESGREAEDLRVSVTSKGGTTAAALEVFDSSGFRDIVEKAVVAARDRARELSKEAN